VQWDRLFSVGRYPARPVWFIALTVVGLGLCASWARAEIPVGVSGWYWAAPLPHGQEVFDLDFVGSRGYAVGGDGLVLRSDDGGRSWASAGYRTDAWLNELAVLSPDSLIVRSACRLRRSDDGGRTFRILRLPGYRTEYDCYPKPQLNGLEFPTPDVGYVSAQGGRLFRTEDGGRSFSLRGRVPGGFGQDPSGGGAVMAFGDVHTGVAVLDRRIYRTTDGGRSWTTVAVVGQHLNDVTMVTPAVGYAVGGGGLLARTSDAGATWTERRIRFPEAGTGFAQNLARVDCANEQLCAASAGWGDRLVYLFDGGATATSVRHGFQSVSQAAFTDPTRVVATGINGLMLLLDHGGASIERIGMSPPPGLRRLTRAGMTGTAWALGSDGWFARTTEQGGDWKAGRILGARALLDVSFANPQVGYALERQGRLYRTVGGGSDWQFVRAVPAWPARLLAIDEQRLLVVGPSGMQSSDDAGVSFAPVPGAIGRARIRAVDRASGTLAAFGGSGMWTSSDGRRWRTVRLPHGVRLAHGDLITAGVVHILDQSGRFWTTRDAGRNWRQGGSTGPFVPRGLSFVDRRHGFAFVPRLPGIEGWRTPNALGGLLRTDDGGATWRPQAFHTDELRGVLALTVDDALAVASDSDSRASALLSTRTRGDSGRRSRLVLGSLPNHLPGPAELTVRGRLTPAAGGEQIVVSATGHRAGSPPRSVLARASRRGTFTARLTIAKTSVVVAYFLGDHDRRSAGSRSARIAIQRR
jgi:photosystem II stability/assembly factor-like uncharacterized protein